MRGQCYLDTDDQHTRAEEAANLEAEHGPGWGLLADHEGEGGEQQEAEDGQHQRAEVHRPPGEGHQDPGQGQRGEQATHPDHDGGDVGHAGGVLTPRPRGGHGHIVTSVHTEHRAVPWLREHRVKNGDAVGTNDADPTELLDLL